MSEETLDKVICHACSKELQFEAKAKIGKSEECDYCYADIRCCKMCEYYSPSDYNECREPSAERILEKTKSNFCDYFELKGRAVDKDKEKNDLVSAANSLFKD